MDLSVMFQLSYGLYVLTARAGKDNGCIINSVMQITSAPNQIVVGINKNNYTNDMIFQTGNLNISVLSSEVSPSLFQQFGYQTGKKVDKFKNFSDVKRAENGIYYITQGTNAWLSARVNQVIDCGTHNLFLAKVMEGERFNAQPSVTYQYYQDQIKSRIQIKNPDPSKENRMEGQKRTNSYVCKVCGYIYTGDELPEDYICPVCKHDTQVFERISL